MAQVHMSTGDVQGSLPITVTEDAVRAALRQVDDPEVGMNVVDLGLVYRIAVTSERIDVDMTMTTPACPMGDMILDAAHEAIRDVAPDDAQIEVHLVWDPPWDPSKMSEQAREHFGWNGE